MERAAYKADGDVQRKIKGLNVLFNPLTFWVMLPTY